MNDKYLELYNKWHSSFMFSAFGSADPRAKESYEELKEWCKNNISEFKKSILEQLKEGPNESVRLLDDITDHIIKYEGYCPLDLYCSMWIYILEGTIKEKEKNGFIPNYYLDPLSKEEIEENKKKLKIDFYDRQRTT